MKFLGIAGNLIFWYCVVRLLFVGFTPYHATDGKEVVLLLLALVTANDAIKRKATRAWAFIAVSLLWG